MQFAVVAASGSVALLADAIHNVGDATTAVPLWIAFIFAQRKADSRFTYGYGRVEDLAGAAIVLVIFSSVIVAVWQALDRLLHPHPSVYGRSLLPESSVSWATESPPFCVSESAGR